MEEKNTNEPLDKNQTELEEDMEEELKQENIEITDLASYVKNVQGVSAQTKQDISKLLELLKQAPSVGAAAAVKMGKDAIDEIGKQTKKVKEDFIKGVGFVKTTIETEIGNAKDAFDEYKINVGKDFEEVDNSELASDMAVHRVGSRENINVEEWAKGKKEEGKFSDKIVDTVKDVKSNSKDVKTKVASGAVKVAGFVGKGLVLFGQKGLAKAMIDKVGQYGESFIAKDSRIAKIMEKGAEKGFAIVDSVREAKEDFGYYKAAVQKDAKAIEDSELASDMSVHKIASKENRKIEEWAKGKKEEGRADVVVDSVRNVQKASKDMRTKVASGAVKVAGFFGKGLALLGKKDLAKEMVENVGERAGKFVERDSRIGKIMQRGAESGFIVGDGVKQFRRDIKDAAETAAIYGMMAGDKVKDVAETVAIYGMVAGDVAKETAKDGAILLGKATYAPIGIGIGIAEYTVDTVNNKIVQPGINLANDVKENIIDPNVKEVIKKAGQTKDYGGKLLDLAIAKIEQFKNLPTNLRGRAESLLKSVADKIGPTIEDITNAEERTEVVTQKDKAAREAFNTLTGKETKQNSDSGERYN